jgi:hypothetical protein
MQKPLFYHAAFCLCLGTFFFNCSDKIVSISNNPSDCSVAEIPSVYTNLFTYGEKDGEGRFLNYIGVYGFAERMRYSSWSKNWTQIVQGEFSGDATPDLMFYSKSEGVAEFYKGNGDGTVSLMKRITGWSKDWSIILTGEFGGDQLTDLFFYSGSQGVAEIYKSIGNGNVSRLARFTGWSKDWSIIVPGDFAGNNYTDFLFYSAQNGVGEFYRSNGNGSVTFLKKYTSWSRDWDIIVPASVIGGSGDKYTDLMFYDREGGTAECYTSNGDGGVTFKTAFYSWDQDGRGWNQIVAGNFNGDSMTDFLFYGARKACCGQDNYEIKVQDGTIFRRYQTGSLPVNQGLFWATPHRLVGANFIQ